MTPTSPVTLSREEEAELRADLAKYPVDRAGPHDPLTYARRLLATLDASRAVTETAEGLDVERLARAMEAARTYISSGGHGHGPREMKRWGVTVSQAGEVAAEYVRLGSPQPTYGPEDDALVSRDPIAEAGPTCPLCGGFGYVVDVTDVIEGAVRRGHQLHAIPTAILDEAAHKEEHGG